MEGSSPPLTNSPLSFDGNISRTAETAVSFFISGTKTIASKQEVEKTDAFVYTGI